MLSWLKSLFKVPEPAGPPTVLKTISVDQPSITQDGINTESTDLRIESNQSRTVRLYELDDLELENCIFTYRAQLKSQDVQKGAYLEMWCRFPGQGEFFSKGIQNKIQGTNDWSSFEIPFYLKKNQRPNLIKLNIVFEGPGTVWMKDIELLKTELR